MDVRESPHHDGRSSASDASASPIAMQGALDERATQPYVLRLYVAGTTPHSTRALSNIRRICEQHLAGRYDLEVVDILQHPILAKGEQIIAAPTLIRELPLPLRRFIGDMSETERILVGLDIVTPHSASRQR